MSDELNKALILKEFRNIPGVGKSIANDLWDLGFRSLDAISTAEPQKMYDDFCRLVNQKVDMCLLYVFRCACYYTSRKDHEPELLKWWNWKDLEFKQK